MNNDQEDDLVPVCGLTLQLMDGYKPEPGFGGHLGYCWCLESEPESKVLHEVSAEIWAHLSPGGGTCVVFHTEMEAFEALTKAVGELKVTLLRDVQCTDGKDAEIIAAFNAEMVKQREEFERRWKPLTPDTNSVLLRNLSFPMTDRLDKFDEPPVQE